MGQPICKQVADLPSIAWHGTKACDLPIRRDFSVWYALKYCIHACSKRVPATNPNADSFLTTIVVLLIILACWLLLICRLFCG